MSPSASVTHKVVVDATHLTEEVKEFWVTYLLAYFVGWLIKNLVVLHTVHEVVWLHKKTTCILNFESFRF